MSNPRHFHRCLTAVASLASLCGTATAQPMLARVHFRSTSNAVGVTPPATYGVNMYGLLAPDGSVQIRANVAGNFGLWVSSADGVQKIMKYGEAAPGLTLPANFQSGGTNSSPRGGRTAFSAKLNPSTPVNEGVWIFDRATGASTLVLRPGSTLANTGATIDGPPQVTSNVSSSSLHIDNDGRVFLNVYSLGLRTVVRARPGEATKVIAEGDDAWYASPGRLITQVNVLGVSPEGSLDLLVEHADTQGTRRGLLSGPEGSFGLVYMEGQTIQGLPPDNQGRSNLPKMKSGNAVFSTVLSGSDVQNWTNDALLVATDSGVRVAARESAPVPGLLGCAWRATFPSYEIGADGSVVFVGQFTSPGGNQEGLFWNTPAGTQPIVANDAVFGLETGETAFTSLMSYVITPDSSVLLSVPLRPQVGLSRDAFLIIRPGESVQVMHRGGDLIDIDGVLTLASVRTVLGANADGTVLLELQVGTNERVLATVNLLEPGVCPADIANAMGEPSSDGAVDISDLLFFLAEFEAGTPGADVDNDGSDPLTPDGGVDINDLISFLRRFEVGC